MLVQSRTEWRDLDERQSDRTAGGEQRGISSRRRLRAGSERIEFQD